MLKVLFVAMPFSVHTSRWIGQLNNTNYEVHLFSSMKHAKVHDDIKGVIIHESFYNNTHPEVKGNSYRSIYLGPLAISNNRLYKQLFRKGASATGIEKPLAQQLATVIDKVKPQIIHSLETQHAGYLVADARKLVTSRFPCWIHSNWGIDLHFFGRLQSHVAPITNTLAGVDILIVEGKRDERLARELGYNGAVITFPSVGGGFTVPDIPVSATSSRKKILVKGMQDMVRRGLVALRALERCADLLNDFEIILYSSDEITRAAAELFYHNTGKKILIAGKLSQHDMLLLNAASRLNICVNMSDGLPNAMLEAMLMGAFPIQSDTSLAGEWISNGISGLLISPEDPDILEMAIREALTNDEMVDAAAVINRQLVTDRLEYDTIKAAVLAMYEQAATNRMEKHAPLT